MFSTVNDDSFEHCAHEFRIPLFKIDLPVGVAEDLLRGSRKRPKVLYVRQYTAFMPAIDFRIAQYGLQLCLHELVECSFHVDQSGRERHRQKRAGVLSGHNMLRESHQHIHAPAANNTLN